MGKLAIVTGGGRGIGAAICRLLAEAGHDICVNYQSDRHRAEAVVAQCQALGVKAQAIQADVGDRRAVAAMFATCDEVFGPPAVLVNNAGTVGARGKLVDLDETALTRAFATNLFGPVYCMQEAIRRMSRENGGGGGSIVNISSIAATIGSPGEYVHYAASKAALDALTVGLSKEVGPEGIRVNSVQAGTADTEIHEREGNPERPAMVAATAPLRRIATPEDIAEAVAWLASDKAAYTTGAVLRVGGGL